MHPEAMELAAMEPTIGQQMRCDSFVAACEGLSRTELLEAIRPLAQHFFCTSPQVVRWLASEAAKNLVNS